MSVDAPGEVVSLNSHGVGHQLFSFMYSDGFEPLANPQKLDLTRLTHLNDLVLTKLDLPKMESFDFNAADKDQSPGFLIQPPGFDPTKKYPVKFLIHGGPQGAWGDAWSYRWKRRASRRHTATSSS